MITAQSIHKYYAIISNNNNKKDQELTMFLQTECRLFSRTFTLVSNMKVSYIDSFERNHTK